MPCLTLVQKGKEKIMNIKEYIKKDGTKVYRANVYIGVDVLRSEERRVGKECRL